MIMMFTEKFKLKNKEDKFNEYVYLLFKKDDEYSIFVYHLIGKSMTGFFSKKFVGEYKIVAYTTQYDGHNTNILDMYPIAVHLDSLDNVDYYGNVCAVNANQPEYFYQVVGSLTWGITKKYKAIPFGKGVYHTKFSQRHRSY